MGINILESITNELIALAVVIPTVITAAYISVTSGELVLLPEATLIVLGFYFGVKKNR